GVASEMGGAAGAVAGQWMVARRDNEERFLVAPEYVGAGVKLRPRAERKLDSAVEQSLHQQGAKRRANPDGQGRMRPPEVCDQTRHEVLATRGVRAQCQASHAPLRHAMYLVAPLDA